jgi:outer membrane protein assembly factor BamB
MTAVAAALLLAVIAAAQVPTGAAAAGLATARAPGQAAATPAPRRAIPRVPGRPSRHRATQSASAQDWPTFLHDASRTSASTEPILTTANVPYLQPQWSYATGGIVAASPAVVGGVVYVGSWDGNQYALDAQTGALIWSTPLGITNAPICVPPTLGITSSPTVVNGVVYVGGGDSYWYALDASTGAVLWRVFTGLNTQAGAHYNWSSPLIVGNFAYIGIASICDAPLVQGQVLKVDLTTHAVVGTASLVPDGQVGGGVWTTPAYDASTNTIFVSTGTLNLYSQQLSQAVVAIDANSMVVTDHWQLPFESAVSDSDWGTTPTLDADSGGNPLLSLTNKNGILYTFARNNLAAGPIWQRQIAIGGDCPTCGDGSIASGAFANGVLYYAGGANVDANGIGHGGSVTAFDPGTGTVLWYHATQQAVIGSLVYDNGVIFDPQGQYMEAIDAATGHAIWDYALTTGTYAAAAISNGVVYIGGVDAKVHAFGLPATLPGPPPPDPSCPAGFLCQDIGSPGVPGSEQVNGDGSVTATASGDARPQGDQMRIITEPATGDFQVGVRDLSEQDGSVIGLTGYQQPQVGIVVRQSNAPGAPFYAALQDPTYPAEGESVANIIIYYRQFWGAPRRTRSRFPGISWCSVTATPSRRCSATTAPITR